MRTFFKVIGILFLVVLFVAGGAFFALPHLLSSDMVKDRIEAMVEQKTGRKLSINGRSSFSLFPQIAVSMHDITLANPPGMEGPPLVHMQALKANLKFKPLLKGKTEIDSLTFEKPRFDLQVTKSGRQNWSFEPAAKRTRSLDSIEPVDIDSSETVGFGTILIESGVLRYEDKRTGLEEVIEVEDLTLKQIRAVSGNEDDQSVIASVTLKWRQQSFAVKGRIDQLNMLLNQKPSNAALQITSSLAEAQYVGLLIPAPDISIDGTMRATSPSVRKLAAFIGAELPAGKGFGPFSFKGKLTGSQQQISFNKAALVLDDTSMDASGSLKLGQPRPQLKANINADILNLNPYLGSSKPDTATADNGDEVIDLSGLKAVDANLDLTARQILYQKTVLENARLKANLDNGLMTADIDRLELYRGRATGNMRLDGRKKAASVAGKLVLKNVMTGALLRDFAGFSKLAGRGNINVDVSSRGQSRNALMATLKGNSDFKLTDGRVEGFDLGKYVGKFSLNDLPGSFRPPHQRSVSKPATAYDELSGRFTFDKGYARNKDFLMRGQFFKVRASGWLNLVKKTLDFKVAPKLMSGAWNFTPALRITGPWSKPKSAFNALAFLGGGKSVLRSVTSALQGENLQDSLQLRGLKNDAEVEAYLAGKKVDASNGTPANDNNRNDLPLDDLGGELGKVLKNKDAGKLLKGLFQ